MNAGNAAFSAACWSFIDTELSITKRKSTFLQPSGSPVVVVVPVPSVVPSVEVSVVPERVSVAVTPVVVVPVAVTPVVVPVEPDEASLVGAPVVSPVLPDVDIVAVIVAVADTVAVAVADTVTVASVASLVALSSPPHPNASSTRGSRDKRGIVGMRMGSPRGQLYDDAPALGALRSGSEVVWL